MFKIKFNKKVLEKYIIFVYYRIKLNKWKMKNEIKKLRLTKINNKLKYHIGIYKIFLCILVSL